MGKLYIKPSKEEQFKKLRPSKETIGFLLNYSKALRITNFGKFQFETILN